MKTKKIIDNHSANKIASVVQFDMAVVDSAASIIQKPLNEDTSKKSKLLGFFKKYFNGENLLLISTVIAVILGISIGFIIRAAVGDSYFNENEIKYFSFVGQIFLRMLKFLILPLIGSSLIYGIAGLGAGNGNKIAARALTYYFLSTVAAVVLGVVLVVSIRPGQGREGSSALGVQEFSNEKHITTYDTILDIIKNLFPENLIEMCFQQYQTVNVKTFKYLIVAENKTNYTVTQLPKNFTNGSAEFGTAYQQFWYWRATEGSARGLNVLGLILFCFVFGGVLASMGEEGQILMKFFQCLNEVSIRMIKLVMITSPFGIFSLILATIIEMKDPSTVFASISIYMLTVIIGLFIHGCILLPLTYWIITRGNIWTYTKNLTEALLIALATASSTAALPTSLRCTEEKNKINKLISRFVLPVGATVNMNGTALYEAVAVIFIAQLCGRSLTFLDLVIASVCATLASIGAASVPSAGLVTMLIILSALDLPADKISLIYTVDWFLDRLRTTINVWGDAIGCGIVAHLSKDDIENLDNEINVEFSLSDDSNATTDPEYQGEPEKHIFKKIESF